VKAITQVGMRRRILVAGLMLVLGLALFGAVPQTAHAQAAYPSSPACSANYPAGNYTSGFGTTLDSVNNVPACSNGYDGYWSGVTSSAWLGVPFQCTELIRRWAYFQYGNSPSSWANTVNGQSDGNAANMWWAHPGGWYQHLNGSSHLPWVGDIIVWGPVDANGNPLESQTLNYPGHVAIIKSVSTVSSTQWKVTAAVQQNIANGNGQYITYSDTTGTIGKYDVPAVYVLSMNEGVYNSQIYGVLSRS
jgi:hypothetical protein